MKQNDIKDSDIKKLVPQELENIFNVYKLDNGQYYYNINNTVNFPEEINTSIYFEYSTVPKDTWPLISWKHYSSVKLWWIICAINNIKNPVANPEPGTILKIIDVDVVRSVLSQIGG